MPSSSSTNGVPVEGGGVQTTPLVARCLRPESRPRNAKKVLFATAPATAKVELHPVGTPVTGTVENIQKVAEDSLDLLPGFSQVRDILAKIRLSIREC